MSVGVGLAITVALLAVNAFFVAGEFEVTQMQGRRVAQVAITPAPAGGEDEEVSL